MRKSTGNCMEPTYVSSTHILKLSLGQILGESRPSHISPTLQKHGPWGWLGPFPDDVVLFGPRLSFVCDS